MKGFILIFLMLIPSVSAQYTYLDIDALGHEDIELEVCYGNNQTCRYYNTNETINLSATSDHIIKLIPERIENTSGIVSYVTDSSMVWNLFLLVFLLGLTIAFINAVTPK